MKSDLIYSFKYYYEDGTSEVAGGLAAKPEYLYNDFDGLIDWDLFATLPDLNLNTKDILKMALEAHHQHDPKLYKMEIVNIQTDEVIDSVDINQI